MSAMPTLDEVLDFVRRVSALTGPIAGEERREVPRHYLELYALYDRGRSMLAAIRILLERGFVHEAMILSRPLLTDSLAFAELAASDEQRRATLLIGWERQGLATLRGIAVEAQRGGMSGFDPVISFVDQRMTDIETYAGEKGFVGSRHWEPDKSAKALATKHDRESEYMDIRIAHQFVHGSTFATSQRYAQDDEGVMVGGPAVQRELWGVTAGCSAAQSTLLASRSLCEILGIDEPPELDALLQELQSLADRIKESTEPADDGVSSDE
jgi:hypothetical protein